MKKPTRILLIASSKMQRTAAYERAVAIAKACNAELKILAVDFFRSLEFLGLLDNDTLNILRDSYLQNHHRWLEEQVEYERAHGLSCSTQVLWSGSIADEILEHVRSFQPSMLIKDVHQEIGFKRIFSTPLDWHLLRECGCAIQLVTPGQHPLPLKVLATVNLYRVKDADLRLNDQIVAAALELGHQWAAEVHVLYCYDWSAIYASGFTMMGPMPIETGFTEALHDAHEEAFNSLCDRYALTEQCRHFLTGVPQPTITAFAGDNEFDLVVMGTLPRQNLERIVGDTSEMLLAHAPCSVLIIKPDAANREVKYF
jgi:universal stress protein E